MISAQTFQVLFGAAVALLYAGAVMAIGCLSLALLGRRRIAAVIRARVGLAGFLWLGFVIGQGVLGVAWLVLSLAGIFYPSFVWMVCLLGGALLAGALLASPRRAVRYASLIAAGFWSLLRQRAWYGWLGMGLAVVGLLQGLMALLPPSIDDALKLYLVWSKIIAETHKLELQPFVHPFYALLPLQVEMHWAALFAIANESAVTLWDYLCAVSFLGGIGLFAWSLNPSRRITLMAVLMMLSTPAFYAMMGGGKVDNASAQYGIAAFLWVALWPGVGMRAVMLAGLCVGWAMASRYTNVIIVPGLIVFALALARRQWSATAGRWAPRQFIKDCLTGAVLCGIAAALAGAPMLIKNWLLVGCPLAPQLGCDGTAWANIYRVHTASLQNISLLDFLLYPFVWTFASRTSMLGNISPLFLGFVPFLLAYRRSAIVKPELIAGLAGLVSIAAWLLIEPLVLFTRFLLMPLALLTVPLSAAVIAAERDFRQVSVRWLFRGAIVLLVTFLLFESRAVVYAGRYVTALDSRAARYRSAAGYDVAAWLNAHVQPGERVAIGNYQGHKYFVEPRLLLNSESAEEFQWLWEHGKWLYADSGSIAPSAWSADFWRFYADRGFTYVVVTKNRVGEALSAWPKTLEGLRVQVVQAGQANDILKIEKLDAQSHQTFATERPTDGADNLVLRSPRDQTVQTPRPDFTR